MTPPAATAAGERTKSRATHRQPVRRVPRRVSIPSVPRRVSGPVTTRRTGRRPVPLPDRVAALIRTLPDRALVDRIVRGRAWIPLLGVMLAGIVAMQVELLKLNASIGRSIQLGTALQSRNDTLRASVSSLSDAQRIERMASGMGMVMAGPTSVQFLDGRHVDPAKAAANIHAPDATSFQSALQAMLSSATQSTTPPGSTTSTSTSAPQATGPSSATATQAPAATTSPATTGARAPSTGAVAPTTSAGPTTTVTPTGAAAAPIGRPVTPTGGAAAPTAGAVAPTGAAARGISGGPSPRGAG